MGLTEYAFRNKTLSYFMLGLILVGGVFSFKQLGQLEDPDFSVKKAVIMTSYPGASPEEVELEVTDRIEKALQEMTQLDHLHSISKEGLSIISVDIRQEYWAARLQQVWDELRRKVRDVRAKLPPGVEEPFIGDDFNFVYGFVLALTGDGYTYQELEDYADDLKKDLGLVDGVSRVDLWGVQKKIIYLDVAEQQMSESRLTGENFVSTLQQQNLVVDAGGVDVENKRMRVAPTGAFTSPLEIGELYLHPSPVPMTDEMQEGQPTATRGTQPAHELIRIRDVAEVTVGYLDPPSTLMRYQGKPAIGISLANRAGGNVVQTGRNIDKRLEELISELPAGLEVSRVSWQSDVVQQSINDFMVNLAEAVVIVLVVLTLAMGWRMGVIIGTGLVLTIFATFILMAIYKIDLHRISLGALIIALGMMVDNSIVVADGIAVRIKQGMDRTKAAIEAAKLPATPLLGSTIIATMAFFPIYLSSADAGEYAGSLFVVVAFALIGSWVIAMTITPLQCFDMLPEAKEKPESEDEQYRGAFFVLYQKSLIAAIRNRWLFTGAMVGLLVVSGVGFGYVKQMFFPDSSRNQLMVDFWFPEGTRIQDVSEQIKETERLLIEDDRTTAVSSFIGGGPPRFYLPVDPEKPYANYAEIIVNTPSFEEIDPLVADLAPWMESNYPEAVTRVRKFGVGPSDTWKFEWHISGPAQASLKTLREIGDEAVAILDKSPFAREVKTGMMNKVRRLEIDYDQVQGRWIGIDREDIARATRRAQDGEVVGLYRERDDLFPIMLRHTERERKDSVNMATLQIASPKSPESVPLSQVAKSIGPQWEDPLIIRWDRRRANTIQASPNETTYPSLKSAVGQQIKDIELPPGYEWSLRGEDSSTRESKEELIPGITPTVVIILVILVALFNAFRPPIIILLTLPFALIGVTVGLLATGSEFGFMALLGAMSLSGMLIKNAVVLLDQINIELGLGKKRYDAVERSAISRLRPVLLASATTVLGMIPLIQDVFWRSMAVTIMSGLTFGTILTMLLVPVLYCILFTVRQRRAKNAA